MATAARATASVRRTRVPPRLYTWATVLPVLALVALFTLYPFVWAAIKSTHRVLLTLPGEPYIGLENYRQAVGEEAFRSAAFNTLRFTAITVPSVTLLGLGVALLLNQRVRGFGVLLALVLLPWSIPLVTAGIIWKLLLSGDFGAVNGFLFQAGVVDNYVAWLSRSDLAMFAVSMAHVWREFPLPAILFLAALQTIPPELIEAARLDRASAWQRFRYVVLPLLKAPLLIVLVFETMTSIAAFDLIFVMTGGGPGSATTVFSWYTYVATFKFLNIGQGAALSFLMAAVLLVIIAVYLRLIRVKEEP